jgi:hypothetical protein
MPLKAHETGRFLMRKRIPTLGLFLTLLLIAAPLPISAQVVVWTQHNDNGRTGANTHETILKPSNVNRSKFGKLFSYTLDDQTYSQPLYVPNLTMSIDGLAHNVVFVTTVNNSVYAWDADSHTSNGGHSLWRTNLTPPGARPPNIQDMNALGACGGNYRDFAGNFGIVGTPVIDTGRNLIYLVARTVEQGVFVQRLHALDLRSGNEPLPPPEISGTYQGTVFDSKGPPFPVFGGLPVTLPAATELQNQRAALALVNGVVYIAWSSHCDFGDYHGWVMGYRASDLTQVTAWNDTPANDNGGNMGGIWQAGQGATADEQGNLYFLTGNGTWDGVDNLSESAIQLKTSSTGALRVGNFFTPCNYASLNSGDQDLGSAGAVLIPGTSLLVGGGKQGMLYVMDTNFMGGFTPTPGILGCIFQDSPDNVVQEFQATFFQNGGATRHIHGSPVFFNGGPSAQYLYVWGETDYLRAYKYSNPLNAYPAGSRSNTRPTAPLFDSTAVAHSFMTAPQIKTGMPGGFLSTSSNGKSDGIVWALTPHACDANSHVQPGALFAFDATNFSGSGSADSASLLVDLWDSTQDLSRDDVGYFAKYTYPTVANGRVYVAGWGRVPAANEDQCAQDSQPAAPANQGQLSVYGLLGEAPPSTPPAHCETKFNCGDMQSITCTGPDVGISWNGNCYNADEEPTECMAGFNGSSTITLTPSSPVNLQTGEGEPVLSVQVCTQTAATTQTAAGRKCITVSNTGPASPPCPPISFKPPRCENEGEIFCDRLDPPRCVGPTGCPTVRPNKP